MVRFYLLFSAAGLFVIALGYGIAPAHILPMALDLNVEGTDLTHIFRAVMGLYLGMIALWLLGAFRARFAFAAIASEIVFMLGLAFGRALSMVLDGWPSPLLIVYMVLEIVMGVWGIVLLGRASESREHA